jgi:hypothetical protein
VPPRSHGQRLELVEGTLPRGLSCHRADMAGNIYTVQLYIYRVVFLLLNVCPRQGRRRSAPWLCAAGAGGLKSNIRHRRRVATANDSNSLKVQRREGYLATALIKPIIFTLPHRKSIELFFSCCGSVEAPRAAAWVP